MRHARTLHAALTLACAAHAATASHATATAPAASRVAVVEGPAETGLAADVRAALSLAGLDPQLVDSNDETIWRPGAFDLVLLCNARALPASSVEPMLGCLRRGGKVLCLGGPPFSELLVQTDGEWLTPDEALQRAADAGPTTGPLPLLGDDAPQWTRAGDDMSRACNVSAVESGYRGAPALRVKMDHVTGWDTQSADVDGASLFPNSYTLTTFAAKGNESTPQMCLEWREADGSRWLATVDLTREWRRYALHPEDFAYWPDNESSSRGGPGDRLHPERATLFAFGLARSHHGVGAGDHELWLADLGGAEATRQARLHPPVIEGLSPAYKLYATTAAALSIPASDHPLAYGLPPMSGPSVLHSQIWRPRGFSLDNPGDWRFAPVVLGVDGEGALRGAAASLFINRGGEFEGAVWGYVDTSDAAFVDANRAGLLDLISRMAVCTCRGAFLLCGGAGSVAYRSGEEIDLGAEVANLGAREADLRLFIELRAPGSERPTAGRSFDITLAPGARETLTFALGDSYTLDGFYTVTATLFAENAAIDRIRSEISVRPVPEVDPDAFVRTSGGRFTLRGNPWVASGVNYWPLYICGLEPGVYSLGWLQPDKYDPFMVERDLSLMSRLGLSMVSVQYRDIGQSRPLMDFLRRCDRHGLYANIFIPGLSVFEGPQARAQAMEMIRAADLPSCAAQMAYDVMWEPHWGNEARRRLHDDAWRAWIDEQYGGLEAAERDWDHPANRHEGEVTCPTDDQLMGDGPHASMVAAYRRFADDFISRGLRDVLHDLRAVDPYHLVGARTGYGGTGQPWPDRNMPFALQSGAAHYDFISPEGWGLAVDRDNVDSAGFITAFARLVGAGKPVLWSEFGQNILTDPEGLEAEQAELYRQLFRMFCESGANGAAAWWWPGGLRRGEESDYGIVRPDGRPRGAAFAAGEWTPRLSSAQGPRPVDEWIDVDIEAHPRGLSAAWERHANAYLAAAGGGAHVGLRTPGSGTDTTNCPLTAVGGKPCNGANPPRYINGEFASLLVRTAKGDWVDARSGDAVEVPHGEPVRIRAAVTNTGEATWISPLISRADGAVVLSCRVEGLGTIDVPMPANVPMYATLDLPEFSLGRPLQAETLVKFRLAAHRRTPFGEKRTVTFRPVAQ